MGESPDMIGGSPPFPVKNLPTIFQKNALWTAITALSITVIGALFVGLIYLGTQIIAFLQPILIPFAVAGVLAYLLEPAVVWLEQRQVSRQRAVLLVFAVFTIAIGGLGWWLGAKVVHQAANLDDRAAQYTTKAREAAVNAVGWVKDHTGVDLTTTDPSAPPEPGDSDIKTFLSGEWVKQALPTVLRNSWSVVKSSVGGFLGMFGFLLSFIIVPLYLYYFLIESAGIKKTWSNYLPLRASAFKDEVVDCLTEINGYLVAFFRGQLFVSVINGPFSSPPEWSGRAWACTR
jgi:predicted PurR-regulated permease PerM